jgi:hypothetical protein
MLDIEGKPGQQHYARKDVLPRNVTLTRPRPPVLLHSGWPRF